MASKAPFSSSIVVESVPSAIVGVCRQILFKLEDSSFNKEDIFAIHLALEEALINAVKHGNKMDPTREVKIDYSISPDKIEISITDDGVGFNPESVPDPRVGKNLYRSEGRGLLLMRSYMDSVQFNQQGNCVYMVRYKEKPSITKSRNQTKNNQTSTSKQD